MDQPNTRRSNPHENRSQFNSGSSAQATEETIRRWPWRLVRGNRATRCPFKSNNRICRLSCGMAIIPPVETARRFTDESVRMVDKAERMFRNSQTLIVRSSDPETTLSSRAKTLDVTVSVCPWKTETAGIGSRKSHKRKVVSREAVTTRRCVGCAETCVSSWSWPVRGCNGWAVSTSHSIAVRSQLPVIIWSMLDNQSAATMTERWPPGPENSQRGVRSVSTRSRSSNWPSLSSNSSSDECPFLRDNNKVTSIFCWINDQISYLGTSQLTAACQMWAVPSPLPVNTRSLCWWNLMEFTEPACPWYCNRQRPLSMPQMQAVWSADAVPIMGWPTLAATCHMPSLWPPNSRTTELTTVCALKLDTMRLVCALILLLAFTLLPPVALLNLALRLLCVLDAAASKLAPISSPIGAEGVAGVAAKEAPPLPVARGPQTPPDPSRDSYGVSESFVFIVAFSSLSWTAGRVNKLFFL